MHHFYAESKSGNENLSFKKPLKKFEKLISCLQMTPHREGQMLSTLATSLVQEKLKIFNNYFLKITLVISKITGYIKNYWLYQKLLGLFVLI